MGMYSHPLLYVGCNSWWRHQMETFSPLLAFCAGIYRSPMSAIATASKVGQRRQGRSSENKTPWRFWASPDGRFPVAMASVGYNELKIVPGPTTLAKEGKENPYRMRTIISRPQWVKLYPRVTFVPGMLRVRSFDIFFNLRLNQRSSKQSRRRLFETPSPSLWRHFNVLILTSTTV